MKSSKKRPESEKTIAQNFDDEKMMEDENCDKTYSENRKNDGK